MPAVPCSASIAPGLVTPCLPIPAVNSTPCHTCHPGPVIAALPPAPADPRLIQPSTASPADPGLLHLAMPAAPVLTLPPLPCQRCPPGRAHEALPAVPCPSPTTPSPPCHALPRSASPTSPNQPSRARPCHRRPRLACREQRIQSWPGRAFRSHACRSTPCRSPPSKLGRSDLSGPCLLRQPLRVPATPSAPCLRNLGTPHVA